MEIFIQRQLNNGTFSKDQLTYPSPNDILFFHRNRKGNVSLQIRQEDGGIDISVEKPNRNNPQVTTVTHNHVPEGTNHILNVSLLKRNVIVTN